MPAAVVSIGKNRVDSDAASSTALYPVTLACDDNPSIACAREIRGIASRAYACTPACLSAPIELSALRGDKKPISVCPLCSLLTSAAVGGATLTTTSAAHASPMLAPASV